MTRSARLGRDRERRRAIAAAAAAVAASAWLLAGPLAHAAPEQPAAPADPYEKGRLLVQRNCAMCHATGPDGASPNPQAPPFRYLHERYDVENLGEALAEGIITGHPAMPEFRFEPDEVMSIIGYLRSIQAKQHARGGGLPSDVDTPAVTAQTGG